MTRVTALRERGGRVEVELDGARWRSVPLDAAARVGLRVGLELDRPRLRELRHELRRADAGARALRALRHRDLAAAELDARLARAGFSEAERETTVERLADAGLVDDARLAAARAEVLAARGHGDSAIRWDLERRGVGPDEVEAALARLEPERERVRRIVAERGSGAATARFLARRGFDEDALDGAVGTDA
jgi:SOS response regulatory protein OraA/RecX